MCRTAFFFVPLLIVTAIAAAADTKSVPFKPTPKWADVSYGPSPLQLLDVHLPPAGDGPFPVLVWFGGLWKPAKHVPDLNHFFPGGVAVVGVQMRTMADAMRDKVAEPVSYVLDDACRAVQTA